MSSGGAVTPIQQQLLNRLDLQGRARASSPQPSESQSLTRSASHELIRQVPRHLGSGSPPDSLSLYSGGVLQTPFDTPLLSKDSLPRRLSATRLPRPERKHFDPKIKRASPRDLAFQARETSPEVKPKEDTTRVQRRHYSPTQKVFTDPHPTQKVFLPQRRHLSPQAKGIPGFSSTLSRSLEARSGPPPGISCTLSKSLEARCGPPSSMGEAFSPSPRSQSQSTDVLNTNGHTPSVVERLSPSTEKFEETMLSGARANLGRRKILQDRSKDADRIRWK